MKNKINIGIKKRGEKCTHPKLLGIIYEKNKMQPFAQVVEQKILLYRYVEISSLILWIHRLKNPLIFVSFSIRTCSHHTSQKRTFWLKITRKYFQDFFEHILQFWTNQSDQLVPTSVIAKMV